VVFKSSALLLAVLLLVPSGSGDEVDSTMADNRRRGCGDEGARRDSFDSFMVGELGSNVSTSGIGSPRTAASS
jgi:hypothetical protein